MKMMFGALVGMKIKLDYVFNGSEAKCRNLKDVRVMNATVHNQNLEEADILKKKKKTV